MSDGNMNEMEFLKLLQALAQDAEEEGQNTIIDAEPLQQTSEDTGVLHHVEVPSGSGVPRRRSTADLDIASVKEAREFVERHMDAGEGNYRTRVVDYITDLENHVTGEPHHYHNLINGFFVIGDYYNAQRLSAYALTIYPYNIDLLANAIRSASGCCDESVTDKYLAEAEKIDKKYWNWRLFLFSIEAYRLKMSKCPVGKMEANYKKALNLTKEYQKYIPADERGYNQEAEILLLANDVAGAREILAKAITQGYEKNGKLYRLVAPQCCVTLLDSILEDTVDYEEIVAVSKAGIQFTAQEQPSSEMGYFVYRWALALDAKQISIGYVDPQGIQNAMRMYQCAYELNRGRSYARTIEKRYKILANNEKNPVTDMPLSGK